MASIIDNLNSAYANLALQLASATANPKPTYSVDGESYSWVEYQQFLVTQMKELEMSIQRASGPLQLQTRMRA